jgi:hypothetical protein
LDFSNQPRKKLLPFVCVAVAGTVEGGFKRECKTTFFFVAGLIVGGGCLFCKTNNVKATTKNSLDVLGFTRPTQLLLYSIGLLKTIKRVIDKWLVIFLYICHGSCWKS